MGIAIKTPVGTATETPVGIAIETPVGIATEAPVGTAIETINKGHNNKCKKRSNVHITTRNNNQKENPKAKQPGTATQIG